MTPMLSNPYESPREITDQVPQTWNPNLRQMLYTVVATLVSALYLAYQFRTHHPVIIFTSPYVLLTCCAIGGCIAGPIFFLIALFRWLMSK